MDNLSYITVHSHLYTVNTHLFYQLVLYENFDQILNLFHNSTVCVMNSRVSGQCLYTIPPYSQKISTVC